MWPPRLSVSATLSATASPLYAFFGRYYLPLPSDLSLKFAGLAGHLHLPQPPGRRRRQRRSGHRRGDHHGQRCDDLP
ncbi:hypothetical protein ACRAWD_21460 [Caulobacter segnis]